MADTTTVPDTGAKPAPRPKKAKVPVPEIPKKEVKIMMLHGYTQSGSSFHSKTRVLEKAMIKSLAPFHLVPVLVYPTAPSRLRPSDIPGYEPRAEGADEAPEEELDAWAWWRLDSASGKYRAFDEGMMTLVACIKEAGGIDGVVGFSQGAAAAQLLASALEPTRAVPEPRSDWAWVDAARAANGHRALRFAVIYSGFVVQQEAFKWLYEPRMTTPTLHYMGSVDTVVDESRSQALAACTTDPDIFVHPGSHFVPTKRELMLPVIAFVKKHTEDADADTETAEAKATETTEAAET